MPPALYHQRSVNDIDKQLDTHLDNGLTAESVACRYTRYGWNELPVESGKPVWLSFLVP